MSERDIPFHVGDFAFYSTEPNRERLVVVWQVHEDGRIELLGANRDRDRKGGSMIRTTHTVVFLQVSERTFEEIRQKLKDAAYTHTFFDDSEHGSSIDMTGIALCREYVLANRKKGVKK